MPGYEKEIKQLKEMVFDPHTQPMPQLTMPVYQGAASLLFDDEENDTERTMQIEYLAKDVTFRGFVNEQLTMNDPKVFEPEKMKEDWNNFLFNIDSIKKNIDRDLKKTPLLRNKLTAYEDERPSADSSQVSYLGDKGNDEDFQINFDDSVDSVNMVHVVKDENDSFRDDSGLKEEQNNSIIEIEFAPEKEDPEIEFPFIKESYNREKKEIVDEIKAGVDSVKRSKFIYAYSDLKEGAAQIASQILIDPVMGRKFLDPDAGFYDNTTGFDKDALNKALNSVRRQVLMDPVFHEVIAKCPKPADLYEQYKKEIRKEVNKKINDEKGRDADTKIDREKQSLMDREKEKAVIELNDEMKKELKSAYEDLTRLNQNHRKSPQMKNLMKSLENMQGKEVVSYKDFELLNKRALYYHNDRQGIFFSPFTDKGKLRLDRVENLIRSTEKTIEGKRADIKRNAEREFQKGKEQEIRIKVN